MSTWKSQMRAAAALQRQLERESVKRQRDLERQAKEQAKLDAISSARLEIETFENQLEVLLSTHKDCATPWDWIASACSLPPLPPVRESKYEIRAKQTAAILPPSELRGWEERIEVARIKDEESYQSALAEYHQDHRDWEASVNLARKIRAGDAGAYGEAINELSPLSEITHFGSSTEFIFHSPRLIECSLALSSSRVIPTEAKTLTASNKVSVKAIPAARFQELYQDYLCSCVLRVARELFALLPVATVLISTRTAITDAKSGKTMEQAVLSVAFSRDDFTKIDFSNIDPSDTIELFTHRGDFKASRKSGAFAPIVPLSAADLTPVSAESLGLVELLKQAAALQQEITAELSSLSPQPSIPAQ